MSHRQHTSPGGDRELGHEQVNHVEVEGDGRHHVLVAGVALQQAVRVEDDEAREDQRSDEPVDGQAYSSQW